MNTTTSIEFYGTTVRIRGMYQGSGSGAFRVWGFWFIGFRIKSNSPISDKTLAKSSPTICGARFPKDC